MHRKNEAPNPQQLREKKGKIQKTLQMYQVEKQYN